MDSERKSPRVLYLSPDGLTDPLGQSQILPYLIGLAKFGVALTIISFEKHDRFVKNAVVIRELCRENNITWIPLRFLTQPPILSTVFQLWEMSRIAERILKKSSIDIVHCRSYLVSLVGLRLKKTHGVKFLFDMRGFWPDERVEGEIWKITNPVYRAVYSFFKKKEREFVDAADHIVTLTHNAKSELQQWGVLAEKITVIPTCVDMTLFEKTHAVLQKSDTLKNDMEIKDAKFVLCYFGSWGSWYLTDEVLRFFESVKELEPSAMLLVLTPDKPDLEAFAHKNSTITRFVQRQELPAYLCLADATICFIKPSYSKKASSATKMAEAWAMNLPVVTNQGWGDIDILSKEGFPIITAAEADYQTVAADLLEHHEKYKIGREKVRGTFDLEFGVSKYRNIYGLLS